MKRVAVVCEGYTERDFVKRVLQQEVANVIFAPVNLQGRGVSVPRIVDNVRQLARGKFACITTFVDFYQFKGSGGDSVETIEKEMRQGVRTLPLGQTVFLPYVQKYEFEALLFADKEAIADYLNWGSAPRKALSAIKDDPEEIDGNNPPSARILNIHKRHHVPRRYRKPNDGVAIAQKIGLAKIEQECDFFREWLAKLRKIAEQ